MDLNIYTTEMSKSVWDKAFFMDKIPGARCVIDFGCADGAMMRFLAPLFPNITFVGYDINRQLLNRGKSYDPCYSNIVWIDNIDAVINFVLNVKDFDPNEICINFSSVLHEVYSSTGGVPVTDILIQKVKPKYITIRDMYCDDPVPFVKSSAEVSPMLVKLVAKMGTRIRDRINDYANVHGPLKDWRDWTQFLMKIQWADNGWKEELTEDYFSWSIDKLLNVLFTDYSTCFECRYQLPYLTEKWKKEYDWYNPEIHTHAQFILRRDD